MNNFCVFVNIINEQLSTLGVELHDPANQTWIPNALSLVQAVICPFICSISDVFQKRKSILVICAGISFVGAAIAPNASSIGRVIAAQTLIGFGFACIPLVLSVPSEIVPRRWRPRTFSMQSTTVLFFSPTNYLARRGSSFDERCCLSRCVRGPSCDWLFD